MGTAMSLLVATGAATAGMLTAPAGPALADSAVVTIGQLEAAGFHVNVDRIGNAPLDQCTVTSVRNTGSQREYIEVDGRGNHQVFVPVIVRRSVTVSLDCTG